MIRIRQSMEREREDPRLEWVRDAIVPYSNLLDRWWCRKPKFGLPSLPSLALPLPLEDCTGGPELVPYSYIHMTRTYVVHLWLQFEIYFERQDGEAELTGLLSLTAVTGY